MPRTKSPNPAFVPNGDSTVRDRTAQGVRKVYQAADPIWAATALEAVIDESKVSPRFVVDAIWKRIPKHITTYNNMAMGAVLRRAARMGIIEMDLKGGLCQLPGRHTNWRPQWKSLIYGDPDFGGPMADKHTDTCLQKAGDDEPIFVLRAQDKFAPEVVRTWAAIAHTKGTPYEKVKEALDLASRMEEWAANNGSKIPD